MTVLAMGSFEGGARVEWTVNGWDCSVVVDADGGMFMHCWHAKTGDEAERSWNPAGSEALGVRQPAMPTTDRPVRVLSPEEREARKAADSGGQFTQMTDPYRNGPTGEAMR